MNINTGFTIITATDKNRGIGFQGKLPWKNKTDMKYFKNITNQRFNENKFNAIIMGRKTFESLDYKPLPNRLNICITSYNIDTAYSLFIGNSFYPLKTNKSMDFSFSSSSLNKDVYNHILFFNSLNDSLEFLYHSSIIENIFVIGGSILYHEAINHKDCKELLINEIDIETECDVFFPEINNENFVMTFSNYIGEGVKNKRYIKRMVRSLTI
jgi:dihydrofolate reductase